MTKGNDCVIAKLSRDENEQNQQNQNDEVTQFLNYRYLTSCEGAWRIFGFPIQHRFPPVLRLPYHLPNQ